MELFKLLVEIVTKFAAEIAVALGGIALTTLIGWILTYRNAKKRIAEAEQRVTRIKIGDKEREGNGIWISEPVLVPPYYGHLLRGSKPILVVGNLKGGVGKTTIAANLAAYYAMKCEERVLVIDADYQGSISSMLFSTDERIPKPDTDSDATVAFGGFCTREMFCRLPKRANQAGMVQGLKIWGIPAYYDLAQAENRLVIEWVIRAEQTANGVSRVGDRDIRYFLTELLHQGAAAQDFDRIIIDAPPRLTSACMQAFCAATHLLIPTILDGLSGEAVGTFVEQIKLLRDRGVCPHIRILGVVPYVPTKAVRFRARARREIQNALKDTGTEAELLDEAFEIPSLKLISESAGERIPYATNADNQDVRDVRNTFDALGAELSRRAAANR